MSGSKMAQFGMPSDRQDLGLHRAFSWVVPMIVMHAIVAALQDAQELARKCVEFQSKRRHLGSLPLNLMRISTKAGLSIAGK